MFKRIEELAVRFEALKVLMAKPEVLKNSERLTAYQKEYKQLQKAADIHGAHQQLSQRMRETKELLSTEKDEDFRTMAKEEIVALEQEQLQWEEQMRRYLVSSDPNDAKHAILEIRAGTGGDEAALFARDLFRMYGHYVESNGWQMSMVDFVEASHGGYKEVIANVVGEGAYGKMKYESGVHRVQRIPDTEAQGRVHTSAATVVVLPEMDEIAINVNMGDVRRDTYCASGPGGQSVNTTYSAVRLTHMPTGVVAICQDEKSQIKNFDKAMKVLRARLYRLEADKKEKEIGARRKSLVRSGDRSDKIRTYNYPQSRVTDHRIKYTAHNLPAVMNGALGALIEHLEAAAQSEKLSQNDQ